MAKAVGDPTRVRIFAALREGELCVCELGDALGVTQSTLSTHLQLIRDAKLVSARREGKWMYYTIEPKAQTIVDALFSLFSRSLKQDATLRRDRKRLNKRLSLRDEGLCCFGAKVAKRSRGKRAP